MDINTDICTTNNTEDKLLYITAQTIITAGAVLSAVLAFVALFWKLFKWVNHQKEQDKQIKTNANNIVASEERFNKKIETLKEQHNEDIHAVKDMHIRDQKGLQEEQSLIIYGLLACLKGLAEQGCDGPVSEAITKIEKHINKKAHGQ